MRITVRAILFLVLIVLIISVFRIFSIHSSVRKASIFGKRYAQVYEWSDDYCSEGNCKTEAEKQEARLLSIHDAIAFGFGYEDYFDLATEIDPQHLSITICSNSGGYRLVNGECLPANFAGEQGSQVFVKVEYNASLIPWARNAQLRIPLSSLSEGTVECMSLPRIGVRHPLHIRLHGEIPEEFSLAAESMEGVLYSIDCPSGNVSSENSEESSVLCKENVVTFSPLDWKELPVRITEVRMKDKVIPIQVEPNYISFYTPSESCYEIGWGNKYVKGTADISIP